jgi:hypothetical protein
LGFAKKFARTKAKAAGLENEFSEALRECDDPEALNDFSEALDVVLKKYNARTEYAPEIALGVSVLRVGVPYMQVLKTLDAEIARKKAKEKTAA